MKKIDENLYKAFHAAVVEAAQWAAMLAAAPDKPGDEQ